MIPPRGRSPARDNGRLDDEDRAVWSDDDSSSISTTFSYRYFPIRERQDRAPPFRLDKNEPANKPVYEAWNIAYCPRRKVPVQGFKVLGIKIEDYDDMPGRFVVRPQASTQAELADMHLHAIEGFQAEHKRSWATRALCGRGKTYEQDLEERCRKLPGLVKGAVNQLLFDRGRATSTHYRTRTWTVVVMQEKHHQRFTDTDFAEVKRHKLRWWKNLKRDELMLYTVVIRGAETKVCPDDAGFSTFTYSYNPWVHSDRVESLRKERELRRQREALRGKRRPLSPPFRARSPSYRTRSPSYRTRGRSASPPSYRSWRNRFDSPSPPARSPRFDSPPPYRRCVRSESPGRSPSPSVRIRIAPRRNTQSFDDAPFPPSPTPPESFTPPPGVSAYSRPGMAPPPAAPFPAPFTSPFHPHPPFPPAAAPATSGFVDFNGDPIPPISRPTPPPCPTCLATRAYCVHYPRYRPVACTRPVLCHAGISYHPPCVQCARAELNNAPLPRPPAPMMPPYYTSPPNPSYGYSTGTGGQYFPACSSSNVFRYGPSVPSMGIPLPPMAPPPAARPPSWYSQGSVGPVPPAPNPFSPLSTPPLTSCGRSSSGASVSSSAWARTPTVEEVVEEPEVRGASPRAGSPAPSGAGSDQVVRE